MSQGWILISKLKNQRVWEVAQCPCFYPLTNIFFSISDERAEQDLLDEFWGCVNYIKIPYDTLMNMPEFKRKQWIMKHNQMVQDSSKNNDNGRVSDMMVNEYAKLSM